MPRYVDGFVLVIPKKRLAEYRAIAKKAGKVWRDHGALEYVECIGDDLKQEMGTPFPKLAKAKPSELTVFSYIVYKSRAHRDAVNARVVKDPRLAAMMENNVMSFDHTRMSYGGFKVLVQA
jgi:uncharacterized protein YbaA (DUF1428 family)